MDVWFLLIYVGATFLALQSLVSLMTHHRKHYWNKLTLEHNQHKGNPAPTLKKKEPEQASDVAA